MNHYFGNDFDFNIYRFTLVSSKGRYKSDYIFPFYHNFHNDYYATINEHFMEFSDGVVMLRIEYNLLYQYKISINEYSTTIPCLSKNLIQRKDYNVTISYSLNNQYIKHYIYNRIPRMNQDKINETIKHLFPPLKRPKLSLPKDFKEKIKPMLSNIKNIKHITTIILISILLIVSLLKK